MESADPEKGPSAPDPDLRYPLRSRCLGPAGRRGDGSGLFVSWKEAENTTLSEALDRYEREVSSKKRSSDQDRIYVRYWKKTGLAGLYLASIQGVELSANDNLELKDKASITVRTPSRITHETRKGLEEKLLSFAERKGSVSRAEAASFCLISPDQAYRILQQLVKKGKLRKIGKAGSSVQYELNTKTRE